MSVTSNLVPSPSRKLIIWLVTSLFFAFQFIIRVSPNVVNLELRERFDTTAGGIAQFFGIYYIGYTIVHIPVGLLLDKIGPKIVIPLCAFVVCLGLLPLLYSTSLFYASVGRILIGMGSSGGVLGVFKILRMYYPHQKIPFLFGISLSIGLIGAACGGHPFYYCVKKIGWDYTLKLLILVGALFSIGIYFIIPSGGITPNTAPIFKDLKLLFSHYKWVCLAILGGFMIGPVEGFSDGWATSFLATYYPSWSKELVAFLPSLILIGMGLGGPLIGYITEKTKAYYKITIYCSLIMASSLLTLLYTKVSVLLVSTLLLIIGLASAYQTVVLYYASLLVPEKIASLTMACVNMIMLTFGYFFHTVLGILIDYFNNHQSLSKPQTDLLIYSEAAFQQSLSLLPIALFLASIGLVIMQSLDKKNMHFKMNK